MIKKKTDVIEALKAGAIAISTSKRDFGIWIKLAFIDANDNEYIKEGEVNGGKYVVALDQGTTLAAELLFLTALAGLWPGIQGVYADISGARMGRTRCHGDMGVSAVYAEGSSGQQ